MVPVMVLDVNKLYFGAYSFYVPFALIKGKVLSKKAQNFLVSFTADLCLRKNLQEAEELI